jgi:hypothetical protein
VNDSEGMTSSEWTQLLSILMMKCMASDPLQEVASKIENEAHNKLSEKVADVTKLKVAEDTFPSLTEDDIEMKDTSSISITEINTSEDGLEQFSDDQELRSRNTLAVKAAKERQKKRDSVFLAKIVKTQIGHAIASLEEDKISMVIDNTLVSNNYGIDYPTLQCTSLQSDFCGLTDISVGTPLVRFPNEKEWAERSKYIVKNRKSFLVADWSDQDNDSENKSSFYFKSV